MTRTDLMNACYIEKELELWQETEKRLGTGAERKKVAEKISELEGKRKEILNFIMAIDDPQVRLIAELRCLNRLKWNAVADKIGGMNSEYTVKKRFYRFLEKVGA